MIVQSFNLHRDCCFKYSVCLGAVDLNKNYDYDDYFRFFVNSQSHFVAEIDSIFIHPLSSMIPDEMKLMVFCEDCKVNILDSDGVVWEDLYTDFSHKKKSYPIKEVMVIKGVYGDCTIWPYAPKEYEQYGFNGNMIRPVIYNSDTKSFVHIHRIVEAPDLLLVIDSSLELHRFDANTSEDGKGNMLKIKYNGRGWNA